MASEAKSDDEFRKAFREAFGRDPAPGERGILMDEHSATVLSASTPEPSKDGPPCTSNAPKSSTPTA
jgi:hypothetical protein